MDIYRLKSGVLLIFPPLIKVIISRVRLYMMITHVILSLIKLCGLMLFLQSYRAIFYIINRIIHGCSIGNMKFIYRVSNDISLVPFAHL